MGLLKKRRASRKSKQAQRRLQEALGDFSLPSFPAVIDHALRALRDPSTNADQLGEILAQDPGLTLQLLKLVNSPVFGLRRPSEDVRQAVALAGMAAVESLVVAAAVGHAVPAKSALGLENFWLTSAQRAGIAKGIASQSSPRGAAQVFTAGLLQDMAVPLLVVQREGYADLLRTFCERDDVKLHELERDAYGWDHASIGQWMCESWELSDSLARLIGGHHGAAVARPDDDATEEELATVLALVASLREGEAESSLEELAASLSVQEGPGHTLDEEGWRTLLTEHLDDANSFASAFR